MRAALGLAAAVLLRRQGGRAWPSPGPEGTPCNCACCQPRGGADSCGVRSVFLPPNLVTCEDACFSRALHGQESVEEFCATECVAGTADECRIAPPHSSEVGQTTPPPGWSSYLPGSGAAPSATSATVVLVPPGVVVTLGASQVAAANVVEKAEPGHMFVLSLSGAFPGLKPGDIVLEVVTGGVAAAASAYAAGHADQVVGGGGVGVRRRGVEPDAPGEETTSERLAQEMSSRVMTAEDIQAAVDQHAAAAADTAAVAGLRAGQMREFVEGEDFPPRLKVDG